MAGKQWTLSHCFEINSIAMRPGTLPPDVDALSGFRCKTPLQTVYTNSLPITSRHRTTPPKSKRNVYQYSGVCVCPN